MTRGNERLIAGIHHVTAVAGNPQANLDFYTKVLGLRFVKLTVNFDDPGTYHFYFGNEAGEPGTVLTFFPWAHVKRGLPGTGAVSATAFNMPRLSAAWWIRRLEQAGVRVSRQVRFGDEVVVFEDRDGMELELVASDEGAEPWTKGDVPSEHALRGFHGVTLGVQSGGPTEQLLHDGMGFERVGSEGPRVRYRAQGGARFARTVDVLAMPESQPHKLGGGTVHHVAFRVPDVDAQQAWQQRLAERGLRATPVMERSYFQSIYFREPGHVLFEFATDGPGFAVDEPLQDLGGRLKLPAQFESQRARIEGVVPRITLPSGHVVGSKS